jgi:6,7-dimethyl-8-ribityllumazine synthase
MSHTVLKGNTNETDFKIGLAVARWNSFITDELLDGAVKALKSQGLEDEQIVVAYCPGAYEIPFTAKHLLEKVDGVVTLGAVIRGDTPHFDYVCDAVNRGVVNLNMMGNKPVVFGVLTTDNVQQARERCGLEGNKGNKGAEASLALLEMLTLTKDIGQL